VKRIILLFTVLSFLPLAGCIKPPPETIKDILDLKQDHLFYIDQNTSDHEITAPGIQKEIDIRFNTLYFAPWHQSAPIYPREKLTEAFGWYEKIPGYGENGRKHKKSWFATLRKNAWLSVYPNAGYAAITTENTDLRILPTHKPFFTGLNSVRFGYPFDKIQQSMVAANTPVFISHITKDKAWVLAETPYATGWIPSRSVARASSDFMKAWENGRYTIIIRDKTALYDDTGQFLFHAPLGSLFPEIEENADDITILVAVADVHRQAIAKTTLVSKEAAVLKPLKITPFNLARMANELIHEAYGWGGLYQNRDCSSMIKDMFAPFGIWLPRNSADQAKQGGEFLDLQNITPEEKENMILKRGVPYLTLIWKKGHIMLYIGERQGKALVFHNIWSVHVKDWRKREKRLIIGHAAITTLYPGMELQNGDMQKNDYLNSILGMTLLAKTGNS